MDNKQEFFRSKCEELFNNALRLLEKSTENKLNSLEEMKYYFYDNCCQIFEKLNVIEEETEHLDTSTNPIKKAPTRRDEESKKPLFAERNRSKTPLPTESNRSKTPSRLISKPVIQKPKLKEKINEKKKTPSVIPNQEEKKKTTIEHAMNKTVDKKGFKKSVTISLSKKTPGKKIDGKLKAKTPKASNRKGFENTKELDTKTNDEDNDESKEDNIKNCISNITIVPQLIPKYIYLIPNELKENSQITMLYILSKTTFLNPKEKYDLILTFPSLFKLGYNSSLSFMLDDKREKLKERINAIQTLFAAYGDIESYLSKAFSPSKTAQNSLTFVTKEEEVSLSKREDLPKEIGVIFQLVYIVIDEPYDDSLLINQLIENLINNVLHKFDVKDISKHMLLYILLYIIH